MKLATLLLSTVSALNNIVHSEVVSKAVVEKFSLSELKIEKDKLFTQGSTKFFYISFFSGSCLASCLSFRRSLTLVP